MIVYSKGKG